MIAKTTHDGRLKIHEAFRAVTIVTTEGRKLNVLLRDFGWEMNIQEPDEKDDDPDGKEPLWHTITNDLDFGGKDQCDIVEILEGAGCEAISGHDNVRKAIGDFETDPAKQLCSGHGVFPDGRKCEGCSDCNIHPKTTGGSNG